MFSCEFCKKEYSTTQGLGNHKNYCALNPNRKNNIKNFIKYNCKFCDKIYDSLNGLHQHEIRCKYNPERIQPIDSFKNYRLNFGSWNKGLTKENNSSLLKLSNTLKNNIAQGIIKPSFSGKHHSEETKKKISKALLLVDHSNHNRFVHSYKGWFNNIFFMSTYELAYYIYMRDTNHKIERCKQRFKYIYNNKEHFYTPDFIVDDSKIIEIKGYEKDVDLVKYSVVKNLIVLYKNDLNKAIDYVKQRYNVIKLESLYTK